VLDRSELKTVKCPQRHVAKNSRAVDDVIRTAKVCASAVVNPSIGNEWISTPPSFQQELIVGEFGSFLASKELE
jgi:hypothetical protein